MRAYPYVRAAGFGGFAALRGDTVIAGAPDEPIGSRRVQILTFDATPRHVATVLSDAAGQWACERITSLSDAGGYTAIAYDHTGVHDPVAKTNLVPTPMPPDPAEH